MLPRRRCGCCSAITTGAVPFLSRDRGVQAGVNAAAVLLCGRGNVPVERAAMLIESLLGAPVAAGFVARAAERDPRVRLERAGFDAAMRNATRRTGAVRR